VELIEAGTLIQYGDAPAADCLGPYERVMRMHGPPLAPVVQALQGVANNQKGSSTGGAREGTVHHSAKKPWRLAKFHQIARAATTELAGSPCRPVARSNIDAVSRC
jgi:hypothetical protein